MMRFLLIIAVVLMPLRAAAQSADAALLVADQLYITRERELVASGNVEAFQNGIRLQASAIRFDQGTGALSIEGPIILTEGEDTVIVANAAQLDAGLRNGILKGARLVLNQQLQLAAVQIDRVDGRYNQLYKTAVTSCRICDDGRPPLWQIRAKRVIHDEVERQLYFDEAQFRIGNMPVFWLPRLRLPGPTVERATGFLIPSIRSSSSLGVGLKIPYFIKLSEKRDLTITPYLSSSTGTVELRYRQAYRSGRIQIDAAVTRDELIAAETRGYLFARGLFALPEEFVLSFGIETVSDDGYLENYGYSSADRLQSDISVSRVRRDEYIRASVYKFKSLRDDENNATLPTVMVDGEYERRFFPRNMGGEIRTRLVLHSHSRTSDLAVDSDDEDTIVDGRDVARISAQADWLRSFVLASGLRADARFGASFNTFRITQDDTTPDDPTELTPQASLTLRYPMAKTNAAGVSHVLEPVAQVSWTGGNRLDIPNEESTLVEFDQGNLLSLSRFPRADRRERGGMAALGVSWSRIDPNGWDGHLSIGQVFREDRDTEFSYSSGLGTLSSDFLLAGQISTDNGLMLTGRSLFQNDLSVTKAEVRGDYGFKRGNVGGSYVWLQEDIYEQRDSNVSEFTLDGDYKINQFWTASANWRYDVASDRAATAGLGLRYENECVTLDLKVNRRYTSSTSIEPSTDFGFNIGLRGFSADTGTERYVRSCSN